MALRSHLYIFLRVLHTFASSILATPNSTCYSPDGNIVTEVDIQPCIQIDGVASSESPWFFPFPHSQLTPFLSGLCNQSDIDPRYLHDEWALPKWRYILAGLLQ